MKTITVVLIFLLVFTVIKLSAIFAISKLMKPSEDWDERDDDGLV